eukprot:TRINITY_DN655_c0_g1_i6.p1 TRINITY_DN655_c0_g1~~TRINITY_DN655_c0_g1_i6.p1  ORF type:complete len:196 (-),score=21.60 TRINITY_DN655_c0_g1_i6:492-1079(-)
MHHSPSSALLHSALCEHRRLVRAPTATVAVWLVEWCTRRPERTEHVLIRELAECEREADAVQTTADDLRRDSNVFSVILAEHPAAACGEAEAVGFALVFTTYSGFLGARCTYLEDLFVQLRKRGLGLALFSAVAKHAAAQGHPKFPLPSAGLEHAVAAVLHAVRCGTRRGVPRVPRLRTADRPGQCHHSVRSPGD